MHLSFIGMKTISSCSVLSWLHFHLFTSHRGIDHKYRHSDGEKREGKYCVAASCEEWQGVHIDRVETVLVVAVMVDRAGG